MNLREIEVSRLDWICVTQDPVGDSCGHCNGLSVTIKGCEFGYVKDYWLLSSPSP